MGCGSASMLSCGPAAGRKLGVPLYRSQWFRVQVGILIRNGTSLWHAATPNAGNFCRFAPTWMAVFVFLRRPSMRTNSSAPTGCPARIVVLKSLRPLSSSEWAAQFRVRKQAWRDGPSPRVKFTSKPRLPSHLGAVRASQRQWRFILHLQTRWHRARRIRGVPGFAESRIFNKAL